MQKSKLRIGLLLDGTELVAWAYRMIEIIKDSDYAEISLIVENTLPAGKRRLTLVSQIASKIRSGRFWTTVIRLILTALERRLIGKPGRLPNASTQVDGKNLLAGIEVIKVHPRRQGFSDYIEGDELARIQAHNIDVFIRLGFRILRGEILRSARYGVWSYHHGDNKVNRGGPPGFWEVLEGHAVTGSILQRLNDELDNGTVLCRSFSATDPLSVGRNQNNCYWKSVSFLPRELQRLHALGGAEFFRRVDARNHLGFYSQRLYVAPRNRVFVAAFGKHLVRYGTRKLKIGRAHV